MSIFDALAYDALAAATVGISVDQQRQQQQTNESSAKAFEAQRRYFEERAKHEARNGNVIEGECKRVEDDNKVLPLANFDVMDLQPEPHPPNRCCSCLGCEAYFSQSA